MAPIAGWAQESFTPLWAPLLITNSFFLLKKLLLLTVYSEDKLSSSFCLSLATSSAHLEDLVYLDEQQRHIPSRTSLRMPRQNSGSRSQQDHRGKHIQTHTYFKHTYRLLFYKQYYKTPLFSSSPTVYFTPSLNLKPLYFEIPGLSSDWLFTGREWLFQEVDARLRSGDPSTSRGVVIVGNMGFGKTAIIARLVALSCHGNRMWPTAAGNQTMSKRKHRAMTVCFNWKGVWGCFQFPYTHSIDQPWLGTILCVHSVLKNIAIIFLEYFLWNPIITPGW